jgi:phage terminase large subunit
MDKGEVRIKYSPQGSMRQVFTDKSPNVNLEGPAGTGKTRANLEKVHLCLCKYPGSRWLMVRKTRMSMTETCMWTYEKEVLHPLDGVRWAAQEQRYEYPNGSHLVVCGMDKSSKVLSSQYDGAYINELTELLKDNYEHISTRLRNGVMPYQQMLSDLNPDHPRHWVKQLIDAGVVKSYPTRHEDNPILFDRKTGDWTPRGGLYMERLDALTGVRYLRLRKGLWAAAEGVIYEEWDPTVHMVDYFPIPPEWNRYWSVDFGFTNPFVWQAWAEDPDGRLYRFREIYMTQRTVAEHASTIRTLWEGEPAPRAIICDHDAEDRATLERELGFITQAAYKSISPGIQAMKARMKRARDNRPRIFFLRDSLYEMDRSLKDALLPTCTEQEFESYVWDARAMDRGVGEMPIDRYNHGADATRYVVAFADDLSIDPQREGVLVEYPEEDRVFISPY